MSKMIDYFPITVFEETLQPFHKAARSRLTRPLGRLAAPRGSRSRQAFFDVASRHIHPNALDSDVLVSCSLFPSTHGNASKDRPVNFEAFNARLSGPRKKYYQPLLRRRETYSECRLRVYLCPSLASWVPWLLEDVSIDEVFIMEHPSTDFMPGMLWRYLALDDSSFKTVVATGVDDYPEHLKQVLTEPREGFIACIAASRMHLPFAGPLAANPAFLRDLGWRGARPAMTDFATVIERARSPGLVMMQERQPRLVDAAWLTREFWNRPILTSNQTILLEAHLRRYAGVEIRKMSECRL